MLSVFDESDSRRLSNFLQTHIFWNLAHISRIYNQINYRNIWFPKVTEQGLFFNVFSEKDQHLNVVEILLMMMNIEKLGALEHYLKN